MFPPIDAYVLAFSSGPKKVCRICLTLVFLKNFYKNRFLVDGLDTCCKPCAQAARAKHFKDHPDKLEHKRAYNREYSKTHPRDRSQYDKQRRQRYPEKIYQATITRRARIKNAPVIERINRPEIIERDNAICHICKKKVKPHEMSLDHLIPLSQGGPHTAANLAVAHYVCNRRRGAGKIPAQLRLY